MRFPSALLFCALAASLSGCIPNAPAPTRRQITSQTAPSFTSKERGFAVWLPVVPVPTQQEQKLPTGQTMTAHIFLAQSNPVSYGIVATPIPAGVDVSNTKAQLDATQGGFISSSQAKLIKSEDIQIGGFQGREITTSSLGGAATGRTRFLMTPKSSYLFFAAGEKAAMQSQKAQVDKVLDSFQILP